MNFSGGGDAASVVFSDALSRMFTAIVLLTKRDCSGNCR